MANYNIYHGKGTCTIDAPNVMMVLIRYKGRIKILDKTQSNCHILAGKDKVIIFSTQKTQKLNHLFDYEGELNILSVEVINYEKERILCGINHICDIINKIETNIDEISETYSSLNSTYTYKGKQATTQLDINIVEGLHTDKQFLKRDGSVYFGSYHIHTFPVLKIMTGSSHNENSEDLYIKRKDGQMVALEVKR